MQIGVVARKIGLSIDAIRFYERNSLLPRPARTPGGFRQYGQSDVETLTFIRRAQSLGFKLKEIRGLLRLRASRLQPCAPVRRRLQEKLADVRQKFKDLRKLEGELRLACAVATKNFAIAPRISAAFPHLTHLSAGGSAAEQLVARHAGQNLRVLVVWEPMLPTDWRPPSRSTLARVPDLRTRQFWDPKHLVAGALRESAKQKPPQPGPECCIQKGFYWDDAILYAPHERWEDEPVPSFWNGPVVHVIPGLKNALNGVP